jgi:hypothetical protein
VDINELVLDEVAINTAVDAIIEQIAAMNDNDGRQLFKSVKRGLELPQGTPNESNSPAVFIWHDAAQYRSDGAQLWFDTATATIDLFVVCYSFNDSDLQAQRERLCAHVLRRLQQPAGGVTTVDRSYKPIQENTGVRAGATPVVHLAYLPHYRSRGEQPCLAKPRNSLTR